MSAMDGGHLQIVKLLLGKSADVKAVNQVCSQLFREATIRSRDRLLPFCRMDGRR